MLGKHATSYRYREWSFTRMTLITLGYRNGAEFRLRNTGEEVKIVEVASSEHEIVRNEAGEWVGLRVRGKSGDRWVCESELGRD